jgi:hypothetical protein
MAVSQEWLLRYRSYERFMGMLWGCAECGNSDALLLLGLVRSQFFLYLTLLFTRYPYLVVGGVLQFGFESEGAQTHAPGSGHNEATYMFGLLMVEYNNSPVKVEGALIHVDKFITLSLANPMIQMWICSVRYDVVLTLIRYENLGWGRRFFHPVQDLPRCHTLRCQALIYRNRWKSERWMTSCSWTCWWR